MPRTIEEGFREFLLRLTPSAFESENAKKHRVSIKACLESNFGMKRFFRTGSFGNGTSIAGYSDVDYFASIPSENLAEDSSYTLQKFRGVLRKRFPFTAVGVRAPAVKVQFGTNQSGITEVTPADYIGNTKQGFGVYEIPDFGGGWRRASPDAHNAYVRKVDGRLQGKLKPLIRFVKAWKYFRDVPISSFYLELRITKLLDEKSTIVYDLDVERVLNWLDANGLPAIQDPVGVSGLVRPCSSVPSLLLSKSKLKTAALRASKACVCEDAGRTKLAFYYWSLMYDGMFSGYYL